MNPILGWILSWSLIVFATWVLVGMIIYQWGMRLRYALLIHAVSLGALALAVVVMP
jgi:hypothetical protein